MCALGRAGIAGVLVLFVLLPAATSAFAQSDLSGEWARGASHEDSIARGTASELGDYTGLPINAAGRMRADTWDASSVSQPEWQCRPHAIHYAWRGVGGWRIWKEVDPVTEEIVAVHAKGYRDNYRVIYLDGRVHPPADAPHSWTGFSTGHWQGDTLVIHTTHLKEYYIQKNGVPQSDLATMTEFWTRHGDLLSIVSILHDPVYLEEPFIQTTELQLQMAAVLPQYTCEVREEIDRPQDWVAHSLPGATNPTSDFHKKYGSNLPGSWAVEGGAESTYPNYQLKLSGAVPQTTPLPKSVFARDPSVGPAAVSTPAVRGVDVVPLRNSLYLITGAGANITASVGNNGVLLVDTGRAGLTEQVITAVKQIQDRVRNTRAIRYVINTSLDADHTGGNVTMEDAGRDLTAGIHCQPPGCGAFAAVPIYAHENVVTRMVDADAPFSMLPTETFHMDEMKLSQWINGDGVRLIHLPGPTDGNIAVHFRASDVISTGDIFTPNGYPMIEMAHGGSLKGVLSGLNRILQIAVLDEWAQGGTLIVPGHGRVSDAVDVAYYRDMVTVIRDRVQSMIDQGKTLEQIIAARPTSDYDPRYGTARSPMSPDKFVEAVYRSLKN